MKLLYPVDNVYITQKFGANPDYYKKYGMKGHNAVDFRARYVPIKASHDGIATLATGSSGYGNYIKIKSSEGFETIYAHLSAFKITSGQSVKMGQIIATSGSTGDSTAPHLHFGLRPKDYNYNNGYFGYIDPQPYLTSEITPPGDNDMIYINDFSDDDFNKFLDMGFFKGNYSYTGPKNKQEWLAAYGNLSIFQLLNKLYTHDYRKKLGDRLGQAFASGKMPPRKEFYK